jgi:hypothetical protein
MNFQAVALRKVLESVGRCGLPLGADWLVVRVGATDVMGRISTHTRPTSLAKKSTSACLSNDCHQVILTRVQ